MSKIIYRNTSYSQRSRAHILSEPDVLDRLSFLKTKPGVFLETTHFDRQNFTSFLFTKPKKVIAYHLGENLDGFFNQLQCCLNKDFWLAGYFTYEFGYLFETRLSNLLKSKKIDFPLAWLGVFERPLVIDHQRFFPKKYLKVTTQDSFKVSGQAFNMSVFEYTKAIEKIKNHLKRGDTYQVNFTMKFGARFKGDVTKYYLKLRRNQLTSYSGFINDGQRCILSFSPELFFKIKNNNIVTRPMKGTSPRGKMSQEDRAQQEFLKTDTKNRAENIMIVDLLRNDLGKIARKGSVKVESFFDVEKYSSLFQMTSTIKAQLAKDVFLKDILCALFPSGSVTGAPKIRTMQIIENLEKSPRDIYTGALGYISPYKEACFNVAIRTAILKKNRLECGIGGGIVYDSKPKKEYQECLLKAKFLTQDAKVFSLIETMLWENRRFKFLSLHIKRLLGSCEYFQIPLNITALRQALFNVTRSFKKDTSYKVRVLVNQEAEVIISYSVLTGLKSEVKIKLALPRVNSQDIFLYHKTTNRDLYDEQRKKAKREGFFDVIFVNERGQLTEGTITNFFLLINNRLFTPPVSSGLLPGVLRAHLLSQHKAEEKVLYPKDIQKAQRVFVGNSVQGLMAANI